MTWNGKFWYAYFAMMKMTFQDMDDDDEFWDVACGRIKAEYLATDEGKQKLTKKELNFVKQFDVTLSGMSKALQDDKIREKDASSFDEMPTGGRQWLYHTK